MDDLSWVDKARQYEKEETWPKALDAYQHALTLNPRNADTHNDLGTLYEQLGQLDEAEQCYRSAIQLDSDTIYLYNLGMLYKKQGRLDEAQIEFEKLLSQANNPQDVAKAKALLEEVSDLSFEKCSRCGCISTLNQAFKPKWGQVLCPRCYVQSGARFSVVIFIIYAVMGIFVVGLFYGRPPYYLFVNLLLLLAFNYLFIVPHEFSHAAVAWLLKGRIFEIRIGVGRILAEKLIGNVNLSVRQYPAAGVCIVAFPTPDFLRARQFLVIGAGLLFNSLLLLLFLPEFDLSRLASAYAWREILVIANGLHLLFNLIPRKIHLGFAQALTDGGQLLHITFGKRPRDAAHLGYFLLEGSYALNRQAYARAIEVCQAGLALYPNNVLLKNVQAAAMLETERQKEALAWFEVLLARFQREESSGQIGITDDNRALVRATLLNNVAWGLLCTPLTPEALKKAYDYARQAFRTIPWVSHIQGTWGSALVEAGRLEEGVEQLLAAYEHSENARSKATNLAYAAIGYHRLGQADEAAELFQKAFSLDESVCAVKKARVELELSNGGESS